MKYVHLSPEVILNLFEIHATETIRSYQVFKDFLEADGLAIETDTAWYNPKFNTAVLTDRGRELVRFLTTIQLGYNPIVPEHDNG
jgi:hypothetical protein